MQPSTSPSRYPKSCLFFSFLAWKTLLLLVAACSPSQGYDTSTSLSQVEYALPTPLRYMIDKLTRWDAIYYVKSSERGYLYEQEWAFGWGFTRVIAFSIVKIGVPYNKGLEALVAIGIAHSAHLLSVLLLYKLTQTIYPSSPKLPVVASLLYIVAPAGIFLSAPYAESSCALLSFLGCFLFTKSLRSGKRPTLTQDVLILGSGLSFGIATTFRSNGILNGLLLLEEAVWTLVSLYSDFQLGVFRRLIATGVGGLLVGAGFLIPQFIAYQEYCGSESTRSWCQESIPSIYVFVQDYYWNCGLFRYWTLSNLPLFLLATPMMSISILSGLRTLQSTLLSKETPRKGLPSPKPSPQTQQVLRNLAVSQLALSVLTLTTAHVQIITRISSAFPLWIWYLAGVYQEGHPMSRGFVSFMVIYGVVQGGLFASFLPPA